MSKKDTYKYTTLAAADEKSTDPYHFYGVIVDASFPYKSENRYLMTCKVVDQSLVKKGKVSQKDWVNVVFYAKNSEDLPIIQRVGDVIRVHRAEFQYYNDRRQMNVNLYFRGSWCLFVGNTSDQPIEPKVVNEDKEKNFFDHTPYNFSGKSFTWADDDVKVLNALRKWTKEYFGKNDVVDTTHDSKGVATAIKAKKDFDLFGRITSIKSADKYSSDAVLVDTAGNSWKVNLLKRKFPHLHSNTVVRVRSVNAEGNVLKLAQHSNVLQFISGAKVHKVVTKCSGKSTPSASVSTITNKKQKALAPTPLKQLFFNPKKSAGTFHAHFKVIKFDPANVEKWTSGKGKKAKLSVKLIVKDSTQTSDDKAYLIHVEDEAFFGKHSHTEAKKILKNHQVEAILERHGKNYHVVNTKLN